MSWKWTYSGDPNTSYSDIQMVEMVQYLDTTLKFDKKYGFEWLYNSKSGKGKCLVFRCFRYLGVQSIAVVPKESFFVILYVHIICAKTKIKGQILKVL